MLFFEPGRPRRPGPAGVITHVNESGVPPADIAASWVAGQREFEDLRREFLIY